MKNLPFLFIIALFLSSCVSSRHGSLSEQSIKAMSGKTLITTQRTPPVYEDITLTDGIRLSVGGAAAGLIGGVAMGAVGDYSTQMINDAEVQDPAVKIKQALSQELTRRTGAQPMASSELQIPKPSAKIDFHSVPSDADYVLDVETLFWRNVYHTTRLGRYLVVYRVRCSLYQVGKSDPIAQATVMWRTPRGYDLPTHEELYAGNAEELKKQLDMAADYAIGYFIKHVLP